MRMFDFYQADHDSRKARYVGSQNRCGHGKRNHIVFGGQQLKPLGRSTCKREIVLE